MSAEKKVLSERACDLLPQTRALIADLARWFGYESGQGDRSDVSSECTAYMKDMVAWIVMMSLGVKEAEDLWFQEFRRGREGARRREKTKRKAERAWARVGLSLNGGKILDKQSGQEIREYHNVAGSLLDKEWDDDLKYNAWDDLKQKVMMMTRISK
jgi:hypothetical protein